MQKSTAHGVGEGGAGKRGPGGCCSASSGIEPAEGAIRGSSEETGATTAAAAAAAAAVVGGPAKEAGAMKEEEEEDKAVWADYISN